MERGSLFEGDKGVVVRVSENGSGVDHKKNEKRKKRRKTYTCEESSSKISLKT